MSRPESSFETEIDLLEEALLGFDNDEAMLIDELDGFLTGILVCPDMVVPHRWLPLVWGCEGPEEVAPFADAKEANAFIGRVMLYYNNIAAALMNGPGSFEPLLSEDTRNGEVLWELWMAGFEKAMHLCPEGFAKLLHTDDKTAAAYRRLLYLAFLGSSADAGSSPSDEDEAVIATAHTEIAGLVETLQAWRLKNGAAGFEMPEHGFGAAPRSRPASSAKVGRNDPCPCGSGKKYKKCCGLN